MESFSSYQSSNSNREQDFQKLSKTIESSIEKISQNVSSLQRMVNQIDTSQDSQDLRKKLHSIQHYTQQLAKDTIGYLKDLNNIPAPLSQSEQRQRKMHKERLHDDLTSVLNMFQAVQRSAASKEKEQVNKAREKNYADMFTHGRRDQQLIELQDSNLSRQQQQQQMVQDEQELRALEEQERSIHQLETDIQDVNQIFKELGTMVHEQGEIVDSIEANMENSAQYVSTGVQQLAEASNYKNKVRRKKFYLMAVAAVILFIIILIIILNLKYN